MCTATANVNILLIRQWRDSVNVHDFIFIINILIFFILSICYIFCDFLQKLMADCKYLLPIWWCYLFSIEIWWFVAQKLFNQNHTEFRILYYYIFKRWEHFYIFVIHDFFFIPSRKQKKKQNKKLAIVLCSYRGSDGIAATMNTNALRCMRTDNFTHTKNV